MRLPKNLLTGTMTKPRLFLCETDKSIICQLETFDMSGSFKFNAYSELTFSIGRTYTNMVTGETQVNPFYDKIEALRLVYLEDFGYFEIQDPEIVSDGIKEIKNVTAYGLEYTLAQKYLENFNVNTGEKDSIEVMFANGGLIVPVTLYNEAEPQLSLINLILEKAYGWTIGNIDFSLRELGRTFEISRASIYDFIVQDLCDKFNCFAVFDTVNNKINLYAETLVSKHIGNGVVSSFVISPPYDSIGTVSIDGYKTTAYMYDSMSGILVFDDAPGNGSRIEITDGSQSKWATDVYVSFENLAQEVNISYNADDIKTVLTVKGADDLDVREVNMGLPYIVDLSYYYTVDWMGQDLYDAYTKYLQASDKYKLEYKENAARILEIAERIVFEEKRLSLEYSEANNVTSTTVGTYYVRGGSSPNYYYTEVSLPDEYNANIQYYTLSGNDLNETKFSDLYKALQTYFSSGDKKDVSAIEELKEDFKFMEKNTIKTLSIDLYSAKDISEKNLIINKFLDEMWHQIGKIPLNSLYYKPYEQIRDTNIEAGWDNPSSNNYWRYYPVTIILASIEKEIEQREQVIEEYQNTKKSLEDKNAQIARDTSIYNNFTHSQLVRLSSFLREDEYTDDNFAETSIDTIDSLMQKKQELLECGYIELSKLCEPKLEFSMDMANIYALPEFEPIIHQFQLGNLVNVVIRPDYIKRARILAVNINFDDFSDFSCEFGELTNLRTPSSIHADLLANALTAGKSVASNASYWNQSSDAVTSLSLLIQQGLLDSTIVIKSIDGTQGVSIDERGIHLRKINPRTGEVEPEEGWIVNNQFLYSDDNFKTSTKSVFGEYTIDGHTKWGLLAEAVMAGYIAGCTIEGGTINIGEGTFVVDQYGHVTMNAASINGYTKKDNIISSINQSPESVAIDANKISLNGKVINLTSDDIIIKSTNFNVTQEGKVTATSGEIAGWNVYPNLFRKETTVNGTDYQIYMQSADGVSTSNAFVVRKKDPGATSWDYQFSVNYAGKLVAKNADIKGIITAEGGTIAGYNIGSGGSYDNALYKRVVGSGADYEVGLKSTSGETDLAFYVKQSNDNWDTSSNVFYVNNSGKLYAKNAVITGNINANSGSIGSWTIGDMGNYTNSIYTTYCEGSAPSNSTPEYAVFMRGSGSSASTIAIGVKKRTSSAISWGDADETFYVLKNGKVKMTDADVTGKINASSGSISGNLNISGGLINTQGDYTVTLRGVQSDVGKGVFYITDNSSGSAEYPVRINGDGSARFTNVTITGNSTIASACIPNLSASKITSGTLDPVRIPNLSANKITSGTLSPLVLDASVITTGNFSAKTLSSGNISVTSGGNIGAWNVTSSGSLYAVSGDVGVGLSAYGLSAGSGGSTPWVNILMAGQNASDKRLKKNISDLDNKFDNIFDNLKPVQFEYDTDTLSKGKHFGYLAQDVIKSFVDEGENIEDYSLVYETIMEEDSMEKYYQLNKSEFIAINTWQIQKLKARVDELEKRLAALEG